MSKIGNFVMELQEQGALLSEVTRLTVSLTLWIMQRITWLQKNTPQNTMNKLKEVLRVFLSL